MITIIFDGPGEWPLQLEAKDVSPTTAVGKPIKSVTATDDDLALIHMELIGLPMPRHINEWNTCTWYWTDAQFIVANIQQAWKINKEATR